MSSSDPGLASVHADNLAPADSVDITADTDAATTSTPPSLVDNPETTSESRNDSSSSLATDVVMASAPVVEPVVDPAVSPSPSSHDMDTTPSSPAATVVSVNSAGAANGHAAEEPASAASPGSNNASPLPQPDRMDGRSTRTGYVYDVRMRFHSNVHGEDDHPEDPRRIWRIYDALKNAGCTDRMIKIASREATMEELGLVHTPVHVEAITKTSNMSKEELLDMANSYNSIYLNNSSAFCARLSCGSLIELCKAVATGQVLNGMAIVRPPGHHAEPDEAGGFCLYNNVAIAARYLQKNHGLKKIFILDWDVHHGNGTQKAFIDDPDVVYCSIHRYDDGTFYPGDPVAGAHTTVGEGKGRGRNINIPWPCKGMGDSEYIYAFNKIIMPIVYEFAPDFILVSAGFDAAAGDHIGENLVSPAAYGHMTHMLKSLAGGKIILALEGGYNLDSIAISGLACAKALLSDPIGMLEPIIPNDVCVQTIHEVMEVQSKYWRSLTPMHIDPLQDSKEGRSIVELSKVLSVYRTEFLYQQHNMIKLPLSNPSYSEEYLDNVHCTQDICSTKPIYIFVHNIGEFCARTMGNINIIRPDKSVLVDTVAQYVDKIVKGGNELIDIVVPYQPATEEDKLPLKEKVSALLADIWDTYVSITGSTRRIVLLAAGFGCQALVSFMNERQKDVLRYVSCVVLVPGGSETLPMVTKKLSQWYLENSFVVVADDHPVWDKANQKVNSRVGNLVRSGRPVERLSDSLLYLFNTMFLEIDRKLASLPELEVPEDLVKDLEAEYGSSKNAESPVKTQDADQNTRLTLIASEGTSSAPTTSSPGQSANSLGGTQGSPQHPPPQQSRPQTLSQVQQPTQPARPTGPNSIPQSSGPGNGSSYSRPGPASSLVDRPSVTTTQTRTQPYPAPNGRPATSTGGPGYDSREGPGHGYPPPHLSQQQMQHQMQHPPQHHPVQLQQHSHQQGPPGHQYPYHTQPSQPPSQSHQQQRPYPAQHSSSASFGYSGESSGGHGGSLGARSDGYLSSKAQQQGPGMRSVQSAHSGPPGANSSPTMSPYGMNGGPGGPSPSSQGYGSRPPPPPAPPLTPQSYQSQQQQHYQQQRRS
ncbi:histone deacetylase 6 [Entomortierella parvispora]|uniref:histone deacetylase n=1 Tax=Entomortierella parvispora TaxID=205924 RepID=A0A9P3HE91_9FUNG|nr:histone deacetylase 6 [Entomortierella parvispora]